jgi:putrescine transport system ATP-binding protein
MSGEALLAVEGLCKRYGAVTALDAVSLRVAEGEFFALLGPSGCGKTTLMRCVAGFETPDQGRVLLAGADLADAPPHKRPVNMMFQSYALFPHLDVFDNIAFGLRQQKKRRDEIEARVASLLDMVQLAAQGARRVNELSGGQKQRVALARALAPGPKLLLLDEPLGALDKKLREETQFHLKDIQRRTRTSFVIVTHDQDEALALADRVAVMRAGRIEQIGTPIEIYDRPATRFVAEFVGDTNLIEGQIERGAGAWFASPFGRLPLAACDLPHGARALLSVRPERIGVLRAEENDATGLLGVVEDFVFRGETTLLRARMGDGYVLRVSHASGGAFAKSERLRLTIAPDAGVLFAREAS